MLMPESFLHYSTAFAHSMVAVIADQGFLEACSSETVMSNFMFGPLTVVFGFVLAAMFSIVFVIVVFSLCHLYSQFQRDDAAARKAQDAMFVNVKTKCVLNAKISTPSGEINTVRFINVETGLRKPVILLLHGWGGGVGWWAPMIDQLAETYDIYAIDWIGMSSLSVDAVENVYTNRPKPKRR